MKPIWFFYMILGMGYVFVIYITTLGSAQWWYVMYYTLVAFVGILALWSDEMRWLFIIGLFLGMILLVLLYKYDVLDYETRMPILRGIIERFEL